MKKLSLVLTACILIFSQTFAQNKWKNYSQSYPAIFDHDSTQVGIVANIEDRNDDFWSITNTDELRKEIFADNSFKTAPLNNLVFVTTYSNTPAYFFIKNINSKNAGDFEYRVSEDKHKVIVPWSQVKHFSSPGFGTGEGATGEMGDIGGYTASPGHQIVVDVRRKEDNTLISTAIVLWVSIQPAIHSIYTTNQLNEFFNDLTHPWINKNDSALNLQNLRSNENSLIFHLQASVSSRKQIAYQLIKGGKIYIPWKANDFDNNFIWLKDLPPGSYQLKYSYTVQPDHIKTCSFVIKSAWYQTTLAKIIAFSLSALFLGLIVIVIILVAQRRKAADELAKKTRLQTELQMIRSQLNPHFIFNALSSIQGLINKKDVLGANTYLSEFAQLLRNTLVDNNREQTPLNDEIKTLETYLKLEQLRFSFKYAINVDAGINVYETEIPTLLLQPLLENAVKHGIADLKDEGQLILNFNKSQDDMVVIIKDNGMGFKETENNAGYGLKLTKDRIALLNDILKDRKIILKVNSDQRSVTEIRLTFINWFHEN